MARGRKPTKSVTAQKLLDALAFVRIAQPAVSDNAPYKNHCALFNGWLLAFNGIVAAGHPIDEELQCCPHTIKLHSAIANSTKTLSITILDNGNVKVKSDKFGAVVPTLTFDEMVPIIPDPPVGPLTDRVRTGFNVIGGLAQENSQYVLTSSVLLRSGSMATTDRMMVLEYWHGLNVPTLVLPKAFVTAIGKVDKPLTSFGFSENSVTFYFEDGSWIRTQLYGEPWPNIDSILDENAVKVGDVPKEFFEGIEAVAPFSDKRVYIDGKLIKSHPDDDMGATFDCKIDVKEQFSFSTKSLQFLNGKITQIGFNDWGKTTAYFIGDNFRGVLMGEKIKATVPVGEPVGGADDVPY